MIEDCFYTAGISLAATALARSESLTVGIGILPAVARNPAVTAMEIATLAQLHPGGCSPASDTACRSGWSRWGRGPGRR